MCLRIILKYTHHTRSCMMCVFGICARYRCTLSLCYTDVDMDEVKTPVKELIDPVRSQTPLVSADSLANQTSNGIDVINQHTGERWYYSDIVKEHFFNPRNLLLDDPKDGEFNALGIVGSPACILSTTKIQTNPRVVAISKVSIGGKVLSGDGQFHQVERIFRPLFYGKLITLKNQLGTLTATPDHLVLAMQIPRDPTWPFVHTAEKKKIPTSWVHAVDLSKGDTCLYPIPNVERPVSSVELPVFEKNKFDHRSVPLSRTLVVSVELLELFGYFIAEGHTKKDASEVGFTFSIRESHYAKRVQALAKSIFGLQASIRERRLNNRIDIAIYSVQLAQAFRGWFGASAASKKIPEFILFLSPKLQEGLIRGLWRGDGFFSAHRAQPRAGFATISPVLAHQLRWLLLRQRIAPSFYREEMKLKKGVLHQPSYRIHVGDIQSLERLSQILEISFWRDPKRRYAEEVWFDEQYLYMPIRSIRSSISPGRLYNFEVSESHTYTTDAFLVHNCGDVMHIWMKIDPETERVKELKWRTFGCGSAIAATSMFSVMVTEDGGRTLEEARNIKPQQIMERLGGLPNRKIHCSVLVDKAFDKAANDYYRKIGKYEKIIVEGAKVIDAATQTTDKDIEEAVLEGAMDLDAVQGKLKVGIGNPGVIPEVEQLIRFYREKYYG